MFKSYRKLIISTALVLTSASAMASDYHVSRSYDNGKKVIDGGTIYPVKNNKTSAYFVNTQKLYKEAKYGRVATPNEIKAWDIDVMPDGTGLPEGHGTVEQGDELYEAQCGSCHGDFGSGGGGYPALQKGNAYEAQKSLTNQRVDPNAEGPERNFGSYWPQASTLWWYIKTAMPHPKPMSLTDNETYALVAYILAINEIKIDGVELDDDYDLDRAKFLKIKMPNVNGFEPKIDGPNGVENARTYFNDFSNYGNGTRCMTNCFDGKPVIAQVNGKGISDYSPAISTKKDLPAVTKKAPKGEKEYKASCAVCHATDAMGAPDVGNKKVWVATLKKGIAKVKENAIKGINGMPPKGGTSLSDAKMNEIVDYMINMSK